jgi:hypothetical protein
MSTLTTPQPEVHDVPPASARPALEMPLRRRLAMIAMGYIPFGNVIVIAVLATLPGVFGWPGWMRLLAIAWLLVVPPMVVRIALLVRPLQSGDLPLSSPDFLLWWFTAQWQVIYNRLPWIEEMIRLVPSLYSTWMRLWGARVGRFVYWTPGLRILDRSLLNVGSRVVFGVGVRVNPHVIMPNDVGELVLRVGTVRIGDDALVGGYSILFAGCWIAPGEATPGKREIRPFTGWANGRRVLAAGEVDDAQ